MNNANGQRKGGCSRILFSLSQSYEEDETGINNPQREGGKGKKRAHGM